MKLKTFLDQISMLYELHPDAEIESIGNVTVHEGNSWRNSYRVYFIYKNEAREVQESYIEIH